MSDQILVATFIVTHNLLKIKWKVKIVNDADFGHLFYIVERFIVVHNYLLL